tara:strand:+ start:1989 stop:2432 length:444 start_codon:yes stop_codon:yes gene_type:complete
MAITQTVTTIFKEKLLSGEFSFTFNDSSTYKIALYNSSADLSALTSYYTTTNELANGNGYTTGGASLTVSVGATSRNGIGYANFADVTWPSATFTARGALIYKNSSPYYSVMILDFGGDKTCSDSTFKIDMPADESGIENTAIIQIR